MKKLLSIVAAAAAVVLLLQAPGMVESSIPSIYYVTPSEKPYESIVSCSGTVQSGEVGEVYLDALGQCQALLVEIGERVSEGQLLAVISYVEGGMATLGKIEEISPNIAAAAALYNLSSGIGGGLSDASGIVQLLAASQEQQISDMRTQLLGSGQTEVRAPISGIITGIGLKENAAAFPGLSVMTISSDESYKVLASVPEGDISRISTGNKVNVRCTGYTAHTYSGVVTKIHPTAHKILRGTVTETVVDVEIELDGWVENLKPGFTARVEILGGKDQTLTTVPYEAIRQDENNNEYVYIYEDGRIRRAQVITGQELTSEVEILAGISPESVVLYNPPDVVKEGVMIQLKGRANVI